METRVMAIDVGGGTQDILLFEEGKQVENCLQMVLPSQTAVVAQRISAATAAGRAVFLHGDLMGGGASVRALKSHLQAGLKAYATPRTAKTIRDDLDSVQAMGVELVTEDPPANVQPVAMGDINSTALAAVLEPFGVRLPETWVIAVQDHGESPNGISNREFRFQHWREFVQAGGDIRNLLYQEVPGYLTRMAAVQRILPGALVADTATAAIWGALGDPLVSGEAERGVIVVNAGNEHTVAVLLKGLTIHGLFEHHTKKMTAAKLQDYIGRLRTGTLSHGEVFADGGHGCYIREHFDPGEGFRFIAVTGPRRQVASGDPYYWAAPYGNMMLSGCYGLVAALRVLMGKSMILST